MMQRAEFEPIHALSVFQQRGLFFGGRFQPPSGVFGAFHHLGGFVADEAAVRAEAGVAGAVLGRFRLVRPGRGAARGFVQAADFAPQTLVLVAFKFILPVARLFPCGKVTLLQLNIRFVDRKHMIDASIQQGAVMGYQEKPALFAQVGAQQAAASLIEMVGRLVNQRKSVLAREKRGQLRLGLFPGRQRAERAVQRRLIHAEQRQFAHEPPFFAATAKPGQYGARRAFRLSGRRGEIAEVCPGVNAPRAVQRSKQQAQQRGFPAPVAADQAKLPLVVERERYVGKYRVIAAVITKTEIRNLDL